MVNLVLHKLFGVYLADLYDANNLLKMIVDQIKQGNAVTVSFSMVKVCTPDFIDVAFGGLYKKLSSKAISDKFHIKTIDNDIHYLVRQGMEEAKKRKERKTKNE